MTEVPTFNAAMVERLSDFLAAPQRPEGTMSYCECAGFLFTVSCAPELVHPSEWMPLIFNGQDAAYATPDEAQKILQVLMALYNDINEGVFEGSPALPLGCEVRDEPLRNLEEDAPLSQWARGFLEGHEWLSELWDGYTPDELGDELGALLMVLSFFSTRQIAEAFHREVEAKDKNFGAMCETMLELQPDALTRYAHFGRSIAQVLQEHRAAERTPARSVKIGRNEPCPCGSGKKYKKCCGAGVH